MSGVVKLCGGPRNQCYAESARVTVLGTNHKVVARSHPLNGRFSFALKPGAYTVSATSSGIRVGTVNVHADAGQTTRANITRKNVLQ